MIVSPRTSSIFLVLALLGLQGASAADESAPPPEALLSLDEAVRLAMESHPMLAAARARIDETRGDAYQAGLCPNPRFDPGGPQIIGPQQSSVFYNGFTQEIVVAGKLKLDRAAALTTVKQARFEAVKRRFELITSVRQDFYAALAAQQRLNVHQGLLRLTRQSENIGEGLLKGGQGTEADVILLRTERRRAEAAFRADRVTVAGRLQQLAASIGRPELRINHLEGELDVEAPNFDDPDVLITLLESSAVIQVAQLDVTKAMWLLRRAKVEPIPNLTVQLGNQYQQGTPHTQALVGLYADVPLWNRNQGNIAAAGAAIRKAKAERQTLELELIRQLADALARFRAAQAMVHSYRDGILPDVQRGVELVQTAYARGQFDLTRLLQAQRQAAETNLAYLDALEARISAAAEIAGMLQMEEFPCFGRLQKEAELKSSPDADGPLPAPPAPDEPGRKKL